MLGVNLAQTGVRRNILLREYWTPENPINTYPANREGTNAFNAAFLEDRSFVRLKDAYGNTYTYAQLGSVERLYPAANPQKVTQQQIQDELELPKPDKAPKTPATVSDLDPQRTIKSATSGLAATAEGLGQNRTAETYAAMHALRPLVEANAGRSAGLLLPVLKGTSDIATPHRALVVLLALALRRVLSGEGEAQ